MDLHNFRARFYDSDLGIFYAVDPAGQGFASYAYAGNNPILRVDRNGEFWQFVVAGAIMGGFMGATQAEANDELWYQGLWKGALVGAIGGALSPIGNPGAWGGFQNVLTGAGQGFITGGLSSVLHGCDFMDGATTGAIMGAAFGLVTSEQFSNFAHGQGWVSDQEVYSNFLVQNKFQEAIEYFNGNGIYDPNHIGWKQMPNADALTNPKTGEIIYGPNTFKGGNINDFKLRIIHEKYHSLRIAEGKSSVDFITRDISPEEVAVWEYSYRNQGLYPSHSYNIVNQINHYGQMSGIYPVYTTPSGVVDMQFKAKWWHFIYNIPRRF